MPVFFETEDDKDGVSLLFVTDFLWQLWMKFHEYNKQLPSKTGCKNKFYKTRKHQHVKKERKVQVF